MPIKSIAKTKTPEGIPCPGDPERKRVLNILAQRRYRQRQRERGAALEGHVKNQTSEQPGQDGGVGLLEGSPELAASTASSESQPEGPMEVTLSTDVFSFQEADFGRDSQYLDLSLLGDLGSLPTDLRSSPSISSTTPPTTNFNFLLIGDVQLQVPILNSIRTFSSIATALNILNVVWDLNYLHVLPPTPTPNLPWNLLPTPAQLAIPHHPILDALPWPSVREKLICILSLPPVCRPPIAGNHERSSIGQASAIQRLTQDLDDLQEGTRPGCMETWLVGITTASW